jgi:predicted nucleic acid-binding protein
MSRLIEDKAAEKNVSIKTITNDDIVKAIRDAADRGEDLVPQLTT